MQILLLEQGEVGAYAYASLWILCGFTNLLLASRLFSDHPADAANPMFLK
jgi:hypothetical protein